MKWKGELIAQFLDTPPQRSRVQFTVKLKPIKSTYLTRERTREILRHIPGSVPPKRELELSPKALIKWLNREIEERPDDNFSDDLLSSALVAERIVAAGYAPVFSRRVHSFLKDAGFTKLGTTPIRGGPGIPLRNYWSRHPEKFLDEDGKVITTKVRCYLTPL